MPRSWRPTTPLDLDEEVAADEAVSTRVRSRLIISPTDDQADEADTVWTKSGELLGTAVYPDTCTDLIDTHQRRAYGDS